MTIPDPLQDGSRRLVPLEMTSRRDKSSIHVGNAAIFFVLEIRGEEIPIEGFDVIAPSAGKHRFECAVTLAITFKRKNLSEKKLPQLLSLSNREIVPCPGSP